MRNRAAATFALIGACLAASGGAMADTVSVKFTGVGLGRSVRMTFGSTTKDLFAGQLKHTISNPVGPTAQHIVGNMLTFCTDIAQYVTSTTHTYEVVPVPVVPSPGMGAEKAQAIYNMYAFAHDSQFATTSNAANKDFAAAFQMAIWEVVHDFSGARSSLSATTGDIKFQKSGGGALTSGVAANLAALFDAAVVDSLYQPLIAISNDRFQDQIVQMNFVPLPGAAAMATLGLFGTMGIRRRR